MLENVNKEKIAYFAGFMAGDGAFSDGRGKRTDRMSVSTVDEEVVDWINENIVEFSKERTVMNDNKKAGIFAKQKCYVKTFPASMSPFFNELGLLSKKESRSIQNIKKTHYREFLLGFLDADGHIGYSVRKDRNRIAGKVSFTHPSGLLLGQVQNFLMEELLIPSSIKPKGNEKCYVLQFSKLRDIVKFGDFVYSSKDIVLTRKFDKYMELKEKLKEAENNGTQYPKEFMNSEEYHKIIGSKSKFMFIDSEGNEFSSTEFAANYHGISRQLVKQRSMNGAKGWSRRPKTESEKREYDAQVKRMIKKLFSEWKENN